MKQVYCLVGAVFLGGCRNPPSVGAASGTASSAAASSPQAAGAHSPLTATFVDVKPEGADIVLRPCDELFVAIVKGHGSALSSELTEGDLGIFRRKAKVNLSGDGIAVVAVFTTDPCVVDNKLAESAVIHGGAKPPLSWAKGEMQAHLDAEADMSPNVYAGRLEGYAGAAEHVHPGSWEVLCAADANGTFVTDSITKTIHARQVIVVPPGTKHAWQPVAGSYLQAVQFYVPPGPEQRFKAFAAQSGK